MDPEACLEELLDAMEMNEAETVVERFESLTEWMNKTGFSPKITHSQLDFLLGFVADKFREKAKSRGYCALCGSSV